MIDSIHIVSPGLDDATYEAYRENAERRSGTCMSTGEITYTVDKIALILGLAGECKIAITHDKWLVQGQSKTPVRVKCDPEMSIQVSAHKVMSGHNVLGGPTSFVACCRYVLEEVESAYGVVLPPWQDWKVRRVDIAETFDLGTEEAVFAWLNARRNAYYPRRQLVSFGPLGFVVPGNRTELRAYAKGEEFIKTGLKKMYSIIGNEAAKAMAAEAMKYLRVEVSLKRAYLDEKLEDVHVGSVEDSWLTDQYNQQWGRFMREQEHEEGTVRTAIDVWQRLSEQYGEDKAIPLYGAWYIIAANGEKWYRDRAPRSTAYRTCKSLRDAGVALEGTDVRSGVESIPVDFIPNLYSPLRVVAIDPRVRMIEQRYAGG